MWSLWFINDMCWPWPSASVLWTSCEGDRTSERRVNLGLVATTKPLDWTAELDVASNRGTGPSRAERSRVEPSRVEPGRAGSGRAEPGIAEPGRAGPGRAGPSRAEPG